MGFKKDGHGDLNSFSVHKQEIAYRYRQRPPSRDRHFSKRNEKGEGESWEGSAIAHARHKQVSTLRQYVPVTLVKVCKRHESVTVCLCGLRLAMYVNGPPDVREQPRLRPNGGLVNRSVATEDSAWHTKHVRSLTDDLPQWPQRLASRRAPPYTICHVACPWSRQTCSDSRTRTCYGLEESPVAGLCRSLKEETQM